MRVPSGFTVDRDGPARLIARASEASAVRELGLHARDGWERLLAQGERHGRGRIARAVLADGRRIVVKQLKRGGAAGALWRDRFPGTRRVAANLTTPLAALARGVPTAAPVALLLHEGPPGLYRAWLAVEEIPRVENLATLYARRPQPPSSLTDAMLASVRRSHDAGLVHPDLNLGNILARPREAGWEIFIVDLDGARMIAGPLSFRARRGALRRLQRSAVKRFGPGGPAGAEDLASWDARYAGEDSGMAARLQRSRRAGRFWLALHRSGWKEGSMPASTQRREPR